MHLRHLFSSRLRGSLLLGSLLVASSFSTQAAEEMLRKAVGKGAYEMAYSQQETRCGLPLRKAANWIKAAWFIVLIRLLWK
ncbi:putative receptor [Escherichia coli]|uniref:Putative receptor n=1 Tax=Escherichia coli TaxID=562 RepID=A0A376W503_ECOLX|nr:putative receptor [Escherichia coli]